jgi:histidinol-phosphate aminotransferase
MRPDRQHDLLAMKISRRKFGQLLGASAAAVIARPAATVAKTATIDSSDGLVQSGTVRLSSNENPYGPCRKALAAMDDAFGLSCRYPDEHDDALVAALAELNGVGRSQILLGDGSGEILKLAADVFTGPPAKEKGGGRLIVADPTFEAILHHAHLGGAEIAKVPLTASCAHDLAKMGAAAKGGLVYICNPNNPTASITPKDEVRDFIRQLPNDTRVLVDEAYFHYADSPDYESVIPLIAEHPNLIVARTFSKIYGMAGLRCGYCVAQSDTIERLRARQSWDSINIMAIAAARASLADPGQVTNGRRLNADTRAFTMTELEKMGFKSIPSQANFIMIDAKRQVVPLIASLKNRHIEVGRLFPAMPNHLRLTIGKKSEMEAFLAAFREITTASAT